MAVEFTMPQLGLTMTEGTILTWLKTVGDNVALGDLLVEVETEKVNYQVESTLAGELLQILVQDGEVAQVMAPLAVIGQPGEKLEQTKKSAEQIVAPSTVSTLEVVKPAPEKVSTTGARVLASPIAKKIAREQSISLEELVGTGPGGRIVERDVLQLLEQQKVKTSPLAKKIAEEFNVDLTTLNKDSRIMKDDVLASITQLPSEAESRMLVESVMPITGMRKVIAERTSMSWQTAPHVNMTAEVDMLAASDLKEVLTQASGVKISYTDIVVKIVSQALTEFPMVNSSLIEGKIISHGTVNIGVAVALENGLIVPVIKNTEHKSISGLHDEIVELANKARNGSLDTEEISGGTFTVSNLGMFGVDHFTPIINQPESAILGVCRIVDRPQVHNGTVVVRPMMNLCLSFDHRLIDGSVGAQFLARLRQLMEQPLLLL